MSATLTPPSSATRLLTEEEFVARHGSESRIELIDGRIVRYPMPGLKHGRVNYQLSSAFTLYLFQNPIGWVFTHDSFLRIRRNPDRVRGADLIFISYDRLPQDAEIVAGVMTHVPELVGEVKSPSDTWNEVFGKVEDYLTLGVTAVIVVDPETRTVLVLRRDQPQATFSEADTLTVPDVLPGFAVPVAHLFA